MKLHLGCWKRQIPGFVHIDICDLPHIEHRTSIDKLPMIADGTVELIYASHVFEYFDRQEASLALKEWRRVLKVGGVLRLAVPDFDMLLEVYRRTGRVESILGPLYGRMAVAGTEGTYIYHKTAYTFDSLKELLEAGGFAEVKRYNWRDTIHKDYDDYSQAYYPHMDKENGLLISLNIEAVKA